MRFDDLKRVENGFNYNSGIISQTFQEVKNTQIFFSIARQGFTKMPQDANKVYYHYITTSIRKYIPILLREATDPW